MMARTSWPFTDLRTCFIHELLNYNFKDKKLSPTLWSAMSLIRSNSPIPSPTNTWVKNTALVCSLIGILQKHLGKSKDQERIIQRKTKEHHVAHSDSNSWKASAQ